MADRAGRRRGLSGASSVEAHIQVYSHAGRMLGRLYGFRPDMMGEKLTFLLHNGPIYEDRPGISEPETFSLPVARRQLAVSRLVLIDRIGFQPSNFQDLARAYFATEIGHPWFELQENVASDTIQATWRVLMATPEEHAELMDLDAFEPEN